MKLMHNLFINSPTEDHRGCFQFGPLTHKALWTFMFRFLCEYMSSFLLGKLPGVDCWVICCVFHFLRNCQIIFWRGCTIFASPPTTWESPSCSASLLAHAIVSLFKFYFKMCISHPWPGSSVGYGIVLICQNWGFDPRSGYIQEATSASISGTTYRCFSVCLCLCLSLPSPSLPSSLSL